MAGEIIEEFGEQLQSTALVKSSGGRFEVDVDGQTVFSKHELHRHPTQGEIVDNIRKQITAQTANN